MSVLRGNPISIDQLTLFAEFNRRDTRAPPEGPGYKALIPPVIPVTADDRRRCERTGGNRERERDGDRERKGSSSYL
jgi:hypothetical protein